VFHGKGITAVSGRGVISLNSAISLSESLRSHVPSIIHLYWFLNSCQKCVRQWISGVVLLGYFTNGRENQSVPLFSYAWQSFRPHLFEMCGNFQQFWMFALRWTSAYFGPDICLNGNWDSHTVMAFSRI